MGKAFCCCTLETGAKTIAVIQMIFSIFGILLMSLVLTGAVLVTSFGQNAQDPDATDAGPWILAVSIIVIIAYVTSFCIAFLLWRGAGQRNQRYLKIWLIVTVILILAHIFDLTVKIITYGVANTGIFSNLVSLLIEVYCIWVVYGLRSEILRDDDEYSYSPPGQKTPQTVAIN